MVSTVVTKFEGGKATDRGIRRRWIVLGAGLVALQFLSALTLGRTHDILPGAELITAFWPCVTAVILCAGAVLAAGRNRPRNAVAMWWVAGMLVVGGIVAILEFLGLWFEMPWTELGGGGGWTYTSRFGLIELAAISLLSALSAAAWLALRGRGPFSYIALLVVPPLIAGLLCWEVTVRLEGILGSVFNVSMISDYGPARTIIWMLAIIVAVAVAAWIAALPPLTRAEDARRAIAHERAEQYHRATPPPPPPPLGLPVATQATNGLAITSMVLGLAGLSLPAIVLGHLARTQMARTGERGAGMATTGLVLGYLGILAAIAVWVFLFILPAILGV